MTHEIRGTQHAARGTQHAARGTKHEARILAMAILAVCSSVALAMPTQQELKKAQPLVAELMTPTMDDYKAKKKTAAEVADIAVKYAGEAETEAAKFMLYRSSIPYYVRGEAYDKAADAVELLRANVKGVPAKVVAEIIAKATVRANREKAPRLFALFRQARAQSAAERDIEAFRAKLKKNPGNLSALRNLAEALAVSGDWDAALAEFAKLKDKSARMAKAELDGSAKSSELGEFWWNYKPTYENADDTFEMRAARHYRTALDAGEITGLKKNIVEQRIKEYGDVAEVAAGRLDASTRAPGANELYCVIDLSGGPNAKKYPVSYLNDVPKGGWSDEYKTTKLVLRRIEPGAFMMGERGNRMGELGKNKRVEIDKSFYLGVFEVTQKQWELVVGDRPSFWMGQQWSLRPVEQVTHDMIRGEDLGRKWPESDEVDESSFMGLLRKRTGLRLDLPTEAQWEYACRAGTTTPFHNNCEMVSGEKDPSLDKIARYEGTGGWNDEKWGKFNWGTGLSAADRDCDTNNGTAAVGSYQPNNWGLYDMLGNVYEYCLDRADDIRVDTRVIRGGHFREAAWATTAFRRVPRPFKFPDFGTGLRLCLPLAGGAATKASVTKKPEPVVHETISALRAPTVKGLYCVIDLSGGPDPKKYPVSYLSDMPKGGWSDEYKTTKLVLRRIEPGAFMMGSGNERHQEKMDKPFYLGVFEVTQKQWELVMGTRPSYFGGPSWRMRPVDQISYDTIRGKQEGSKWPESDAVDGDSFLGIVRQKSGLRFDLPTQEQWEYACRAGTETDFYNGKTCVNDEHDSSLDGLARYAHTGGWNEAWGANNHKSRWADFWKAPDRDCETTSGTAAVGAYQPNRWGLYDMLGNVREWCLQKDERGMNLGGCWIDGANACTAYSVNRIAKYRGRHDFGFRLCLPLAGGAATKK